MSQTGNDVTILIVNHGFLFVFNTPCLSNMHHLKLMSSCQNFDFDCKRAFCDWKWDHQWIEKLWSFFMLHWQLPFIFYCSDFASTSSVVQKWRNHNFGLQTGSDVTIQLFDPYLVQVGCRNCSPICHRAKTYSTFSIWMQSAFSKFWEGYFLRRNCSSIKPQRVHFLINPCLLSIVCTNRFSGAICTIIEKNIVIWGKIR